MRYRVGVWYRDPQHRHSWGATYYLVDAASSDEACQQVEPMLSSHLVVSVYVCPMCGQNTYTCAEEGHDA